jgi:uncharacterized protein (UPF0276 family)
MIRVGLAYQSPLRSFMERARGAFDFVEVVPDMFWNDFGRGRSDRHQLSPEGDQFLVWARALNKPVIPHSIGLSIGSADRFDEAHLAQMNRWLGWLDFPWHSDHLSFHMAEHTDAQGRMGEVNLGVTMPLAFDRESLDLLVPRIQAVRRVVPRPFLLENSVSYFDVPEAEFSEAQFLNQLCAESGAFLVLDLHNLYVNGRNGLVDPDAFLGQLDLGRVMEIHLAGGMEMDGFYLDAHSGAVPEPVWGMLADVVPRCPQLGGVVFEIFGSWFSGFGERALEEQLDRLRALLPGVARMAAGARG